MGKTIKMICSAASLILALPFFALYRIESVLIGPETAFQGASQFTSLFPGIAGMYFRRAFYILALKSCSHDCYIGFGTVFSHPTVEIGRHVYIGTNCSIGDASIGDYATIGSNVDIMNGGRQHGSCDVDKPMQEQAGQYPRINIGADAWIGNSAVVMADVGKKAIVGAGSVAVKPVGEYSVVAGNPAAEIRKRV